MFMYSLENVEIITTVLIEHGIDFGRNRLPNCRKVYIIYKEFNIMFKNVIR